MASASHYPRRTWCGCLGRRSSSPASRRSLRRITNHASSLTCWKNRMREHQVLTTIPKGRSPQSICSLGKIYPASYRKSGRQILPRASPGFRNWTSQIHTTAAPFDHTSWAPLRTSSNLALEGNVVIICIDLVFPMGWIDSPKLFCTVYERLTDMENTLVDMELPVPAYGTITKISATC